MADKLYGIKQVLIYITYLFIFSDKNLLQIITFGNN